MPTPERIKLASLEKRKRVCEVCGAAFVVKSADRKGAACSPACLSEVRARRRRGQPATAETRAKMSASAVAKVSDAIWLAKRSAAAAAAVRTWHENPENAAAHAKRASDRMKRRHADPVWQKIRDERSSRTLRKVWEVHREHLTELARQRYAAPGGLNTPEANARRDEAWRWILTQAQAALHAETDYDEVFASVQETFRREHPYDAGVEDYYDYSKRLGTLVTSHPSCRSIADAFMAKAIPHFAAAWKANRQAGLPNV